MTCPGAEQLSRWADGTLDSREAAALARHAETCAACRRKADELRAAGAWVASVGAPGPSCLSAEAMAAALESGRAPAHVRTCPRCAAEFRSLRGVERRVTHRISRPPVPMMGWAAAAAVFIAVALLLVLANRQEPTQPRERIVYQEPAPAAERQDPAPAPAPAPAPKSTVDEPFKVPHFPQPRPTPITPEPPPTPPAPVVAEATPESPKPRTPDAPRPVEVVEAAKPPTALSVKYGSLTVNFDGKWVKPQRIDDGMVLRAEGRTQVDFAQARITLDGASRFSVSKNEFALAEGAMSAEVGAGSKFTLLLDEQRFVPQTFNARVLFCARPDRIVVEEGSAKWKDTLLHEGVEHSVKKDRVEAQKRRTLPAAFRARETLTWRMDLTKNDAVKRHIFVGRVDVLPEGKVLASEPLKDGYFYGQAACANGGDELYTVKPNTAIRFRYFLKEPAILELVTWNYTKGENFNKPLEPVLRQWTTVTVYARDIPANQGGKKVTCEVGDRYTSLGLFVGKPETASEVLIDRLEILEIDR